MPEEKKESSPLALALLYLRSEAGWSTRELAAALGWADDKLVRKYERGAKRLLREHLETLVAPSAAAPRRSTSWSSLTA